ncbi:hepatic lectin-like [Ruditapes philippinarum]|uniref:hepatic lectin-like n=1 Tax=Ruditapes philippinarum TaxID=129788 RepID=UPI00295BEDF6|nr:hepatic lectin-like [Ruditapes philippinarum]
MSGWLRHGNKCYHFSHDKESWINALNMCKLFGGNLVEVETATENSYIAAIVKLRGLEYWIGLTDVFEEGIWLWISNKNQLSDSGYVNWRHGEPNNERSNENCAEMETSGLWNDDSCDKSQHFICETVNR